MLSASIVEFKSDRWEVVKSELEKFSAIDIYGVEESQCRAVIVIDAERPEDICKSLNQCGDIITITHQSFYFED